MRNKPSARRATANYHPAKYRKKNRPVPNLDAVSVRVPRDRDTLEVRCGSETVHLTNLRKVFWPDLGITKGDLIQFYIDVAAVLLPHLASRAMVMKRYPNGIGGNFFFMKRAPSPRPEWIETCAIEHASGNVIDFPVIRDLPSPLWVLNLGCIDLNPWYARCDDVDPPDYLHFDLDPVKGACWSIIIKTPGGGRLRLFIPSGPSREPQFQLRSPGKSSKRGSGSKTFAWTTCASALKRSVIFGRLCWPTPDGRTWSRCMALPISWPHPPMEALSSQNGTAFVASPFALATR